MKAFISVVKMVTLAVSIFVILASFGFASGELGDRFWPGRLGGDIAQVLFVLMSLFLAVAVIRVIITVLYRLEGQGTILDWAKGFFFVDKILALLQHNRK